jgi:hypothetical protein
MQPFLRWFALATSLIAVVVLLFIPLYDGITVRQSVGGPAEQWTQSDTLIGVNGLVALFALAIPVLAAVNALLPWPARNRRRADIIGAVVASAFSLLGAFTVGLFFLPTAAALIVVASWPRARSAT